MRRSHFLFLLGACGSDPAPNPATGPTSETSTQPPTTEPLCELQGEAAPIPMRRLTRTQLEHTIEDVLGVTVSINVSDEVLIGYPANISTGMTSTTAREVMFAAELAAELAGPVLLADMACADCAEPFVDAIGPKLFRRPLTDEQRSAYAQMFLDGAQVGQSAEWTLSAMLQSPHFLYQLEVENDGWLDGYSVAARLSYALWDGPPDDPLLAAATAGELDQPDGIASQVERMLEDPRFERSMHVFSDHWLHLYELDDPTERPDLFDLDDDTRQALRDQVVSLLVQMVREGGSVSDLLLTQDYPESPALAAIYGDDVLSTEQGRAVMDPARRSGLLTTAGVMATLAHANITSPTRRGQVVLGQLLCTPPLPPPPDVVPSLPPASEGQTTREQLEEHLDNPACSGCHATMDGIGFAFEHYDWMGSWRETEAGQPIDDASTFDLFETEVTVDGGVDMSVVLSQEAEVATCFARHWNRHTLSILEPEGDGDCLAKHMGLQAQQPNGLREALLAPLVSDWFRQANPAQVNP